jgi:hypothetical protein
MRMVAERLARTANAEDQVSGRFWQGRFRAVKLCDEAALLACSAYVDLNPIRARLAQTPETSDFTSAQRRIQALSSEREGSSNVASRAAPAIHDGRQPRNRQLAASPTPPDAWLARLPLDEAASLPGSAPSGCAARCSDRGFLPMSVQEYLQLLDWTGRQILSGRQGAIPATLAPIFSRLGMDTSGWLTLAADFGRLFQRVAGSPSSVACQRTRCGHRFRAGHARLLGPVCFASRA